MAEIFTKLKESRTAINMEISETWFRPYQVLPGRTHPVMVMSAASGYILSGTTLHQSNEMSKRLWPNCLFSHLEDFQSSKLDVEMENEEKQKPEDVEGEGEGEEVVDGEETSSDHPSKKQKTIENQSTSTST